MADIKQRPQGFLITKDPSRRLPKEYFVMKSPGDKSETDIRIQDEIWTKLQEEPDCDLTEIEVDVQDGYVLLTGTVPDENMRGRIEHKALHCVGVCEVKNHIHVLKKFKDAEERELLSKEP
jgi:osmotically-inducible protein OsmY